MATLEKIRSKMGVLAAGVIGLALLAFIVTDFFSPKNSLLTGTKNEVGEVNGTKLTYQDYEKEITNLSDIRKYQYNQQNLDERLTDQVREEVWQNFMVKNLLMNNFEDLGLIVSPAELNELIKGNDPHPFIRQMFTNREGKFDHNQVVGYWNNADQDPTGNAPRFVVYAENEVAKYSSISKYLTLVTKGLYVTKLQAKNDFEELNKKANIRFFSVNYSSINDNDIKISESELKDYFKEHKKRYEQNPARNVEYVTFEIAPSKEDIADIFDATSKLKPEFETTTDVEAFVQNNSDNPLSNFNFKPGELNDSLDKFAFGAKNGSVYGPYLEGKSYKLAKLIEVKSSPDSVKVRHILIMPKADGEAGMKVAKAKADSILNLIAKGGNFAALAAQYSDDPGSKQKGGELDWFGENAGLVKPFKDFAFEGKKGERRVVESEYGYHIMEVMDRSKDTKKAVLAVIEKQLRASEATRKQIYQQASAFAANNNKSEDFLKAVLKQKLNKKSASIGESDRTISGFEAPRELIHWAYNTEDEGTVSEVLSVDNFYVIALLKSIYKTGKTTLEQVKSQVEFDLRREKKGDKIIADLNAKKAGNIDQWAAALKLQAVDANDVALGSPFIPNAGMEPNVAAAANALEPRKLSAPIRGTGGIFVLVVNSVNNAGAVDYAGSINRMTYMLQNRVNYEVYEALKKNNVEDFRNRFY